MVIQWKKGRDGPPNLTCVRADGTRTWRRVHPFFPTHDLVHCAVESVFGLTQAFFGLVASGWSFDDFDQRGAPARLPNEALWAENMVGFFDLERATGHVMAAAEFNAALAASLSAPTLFVIANDLSKMQIEAKVAEADVGSVAVGQPAEFTVDAYPGQTFRGRVTQIRNAPTIDQNVVTYDAIIEVTNPDLKLKPGMTADVSITVARRDDALRLPNAALRFRPVELSRAKAKDSTSAGTQAASKNKNSTGERPRKDKNKHPSERTVYVVSNASGPETLLKPVKIRTGISDSFYTEVLEGLQEGDRAAIGESVAQAKRTVNPFVAGRRK